MRSTGRPASRAVCAADPVRRFLRPFVWQDAPAALLPEELRDDYTAIPRRVDGVLQLAEAPAAA